MTGIVTLTINPSIDVSTSVGKVIPVRKLRCSAPQRHPGGGGINVARVVTRLGADVRALYPTGGATGQLLRRLMDREGISSLAVPVAEETREDFTVFDETARQQYRFVLPGPRLSEQEWRAALDVLASLRGQPDFVVASGSLPPGVPADFYKRAARIAKAWGAKLVLDTSGPPLQAALEEGVYLFKPNLHELTDLVGSPLEDQDAWVKACRRIVQAARAEVVVLTLAERGALLVTRERAWRAQPLQIEAVSAVGAGDSFLGAMIWSLACGHGMEEAFRHGMAAGSAALLTPGTELCRPEDIERLYPQVTVTPVPEQRD
jgi:6-phosphofructokinase 2